MNSKTFLLILLILSGCNKRSPDIIYKDSTDTATTAKAPQAESLSAGQSNYEKSLIHREYDNDSLLLDIPDLKRLVSSFTSKPKIREKEYGGGDSFGKYRVYADKLDTLIIDKFDGGDYGFGNTLYLKRNDSIVLYRNYEFSFLTYDSSGDVEEITETLVSFTHGTMSVKERKMRTKDWSELRFKNNFETVEDNPTKRYKLLKDELTRLYKSELEE